jgi:hypothetical protein
MELVYNGEELKVSPILLDYASEFLKDNEATEENVMILKAQLIQEWDLYCSLNVIDDTFTDNKFEYNIN